MNWAKLGSRKFLLTIFGSLALTIMKQAGVPEDFIKVIMYLFATYIGVEGAIDIVGAAKKPNGG